MWGPTKGLIRAVGTVALTSSAIYTGLCLGVALAPAAVTGLGVAVSAIAVVFVGLVLWDVIASRSQWVPERHPLLPREAQQLLPPGAPGAPAAPAH